MIFQNAGKLRPKRWCDWPTVGPTATIRQRSVSEMYTFNITDITNNKCKPINECSKVCSGWRNIRTMNAADLPKLSNVQTKLTYKNNNNRNFGELDRSVLTLILVSMFQLLICTLIFVSLNQLIRFCVNIHTVYVQV